MAFEKNIKTGTNEVEVIKTAETTEPATPEQAAQAEFVKQAAAELAQKRANFDLGVRFMLNDRIWTVRKIKGDIGSPMRRIQSSVGDEEELLLSRLHKDTRDPSFHWVD